MKISISQLFNTLKEHETGLIETAAIITSSLRWIITFMPVDGLQFRLAKTLPLWEGLSAILSVAFAVVEVYATAFMMRAWNKATARRDRIALLLLWIVSLVVMVIVQFPPLYSNVMDVSVSTLPQWAVITWIVSVALSTFIIIAGVSYADTVYKQKTKPKEDRPSSPYRVVNKPAPQLPATNAPQQIAAPKSSGSVMSYEEFRDAMLALADAAPRSIGEVEKQFGLSHSTADRRLKQYRKEFGA